MVRPLKMQHAKHGCGFTLLELLFAVAIVGILIAIAYPAYRDYQARARAADIVVKYDALKEAIAADLTQGPMNSCAELVTRVSQGNLQDAYAELAIGFEQGTDGYRAVFAVCADEAHQGVRGVAVARAAHEVFAKSNRVEKGAVLGNTLVSFAVPLTGADTLACRSAPANPAAQCGGAPVQPATAAQGTGTPLKPAAAQPRTTCGPDEDKLTVPAPGGMAEICTKKCPSGQARDPVDWAKCVAQAAQSTTGGSTPQGQTGATVQPAQTLQPAQAPSAPSAGGGGVPAPGGSPQQCQDDCRARFPHGNSRAYRECVAACR
jgi:prepilin-type N-terminal cleavage/methylation domain-containing protein